MVKRRIIILAAALVLAGCGASQKEAPVAFKFRDDAHDAKVYFYASYDAKDRPIFADAFRVHAGQNATLQGYVADIDEEEYTDTVLPPGSQTFMVDQIDWLGNVVNHSVLVVELKPGQTLYLEERVLADGKAALANPDPARAAIEIKSKKRVCLCGTLLGL